jgi:hypothetical protein
MNSVGVVVVDAVDNPVEAGARSGLRLEVEDQPVDPVLHQRPEQPAAGDQPDRLAGAQVGRAEREQDRDRGQEDQRRNDWVHARQAVEQVRLEHPRGGLENVCTGGVHDTPNLPHRPSS